MEPKPKKVLIADDEIDILEIIGYNLLKEGYEVITAKDGNEAIFMAKEHLPDLLILDLMMPHKTGIEVCQMLRQQAAFKSTPIILLTALNDETTHIKSLEIGADDFITKPVSSKILITRVNTLFRRTVSDEKRMALNFDNFIIDPTRFLVEMDGAELILSRKEFELLYLLASKPGKVFLRNEILSLVWGNDVIVGDRTIDVHIRKIRAKLVKDYITTIKGVGYKFEM